MSALEQIQSLKARVSESIIGQEAVVERLIIGLLSNGNLLIEGLPGLAKTRAIKSLAKNLEADFSRIQFTPDLLPADVTGSDVYHQTAAGGEFKFEQGPIFANLVLGDEINRAPAKVQSAMLEAMEERQVTVGGKTHKMPPLFMVMATQNPVEQEGTYPLPEAQMDRFLMHINIEYPPVEDEVKVIQLVRAEETESHSGAGSIEPRQPIAQSVIFDARKDIGGVTVSAAADQYMADLVYATRIPDKYSEELDHYIDVGGSPRASIAFDKCSRTLAWLNGQDFVEPDHIRAVAHDILRHRLMLSYEAQGEGVTANDVIDLLLSQVALA